MIDKQSTLLYVEDEENIIEEMVEILELDFENIYVATNGKEGLEMYKKYKPNVVISDVQMPLMDGLEMSKEILKIDSNAKIILTTAFNENEFIQKMKDIGVKDYVNKPVDIDKLFESIHRCIK